MPERRPEILLVSPWIDDFAAYDFWVKPICLLSVGGVLRESGCDVPLLDCMDRHHTGLSDHGGIPPQRTLLGGIYATLCETHARSLSGADRVIPGEGEIKALEAVCSITRRSPSRLVREIETLHRARGVEDFAFYDDALLFHKESHFLPMLEALAERSLPIRPIYETSNPARQESMGGKVTDEALVHSVRLLREAGFDASHLGAYVIMGLPDQDIGEVADSLAFVFSLGIRISLASFSPIPGTPSFDDAVNAGLLARDSDPLLTNNSAFLMLSRPSPIRFPDGRGSAAGESGENGNQYLIGG